jgi:hypothetical protein
MSPRTDRGSPFERAMDWLDDEGHEGVRILGAAVCGAVLLVGWVVEKVVG